MYFVGIDVGTSSAKLTLINHGGKIIDETSEEYEIVEKQTGWKEINPCVWMDSVEKAMVRLLEKYNAYEVEAIGITGQMHTIIVLDKSGEVIRPALMWNDTRTKNSIHRIKEKILTKPNIAYLSSIVSTGSPLANLLWLKENEPENFNRIYKFLIGPDYIVNQLTGQYQTDFCEASTSSMCDFELGKWSEDIQILFGLPINIFPTIKGAAEVAGELLEKWADKFCMKKSVKILVGTGDNPAAAISTGCFFEKKTVLSIGTSCVLMYPKNNYNFNVKGKNILFSLDGKNIDVLVQGVVQSAGNSLSWWIKKVLNAKDYEVETDQLEIDDISNETLLFYPHLSGDKTIYADPNLTGAFIGLKTNTTRKEMTIAIMEGIAMAVKQLCEEMDVSKEEIEELKITGGGAKNRYWMQIIADVLNVSVCQLKSNVGAGYGIALVAAKTYGGDNPNKELFNQSIEINETYYPRVEKVSFYEKKYKKYRNVYEAMQLIFN